MGEVKKEQLKWFLMIQEKSSGCLQTKKINKQILWNRIMKIMGKLWNYLTKKIPRMQKRKSIQMKLIQSRKFKQKILIRSLLKQKKEKMFINLIFMRVDSKKY